MVDISKIDGIAVASIAKVNGIAVASIAKWNGQTWPAANGSTLVEFSSASDRQLFHWYIGTTGGNGSGMLTVTGGKLVTNATADAARLNGSLNGETSTSFYQQMDFVMGSGGKIGLQFAGYLDASPDYVGGVLMYINGTTLWLSTRASDGLETDYSEVDSDTDPMNGTDTFRMKMNVTANGTGYDVNGTVFTANGTAKHQVSGHYSSSGSWTTDKGPFFYRSTNNHSIDNYKVVPAA
jgi:hypothetical protein